MLEPWRNQARWNGQTLMAPGPWYGGPRRADDRLTSGQKANPRPLHVPPVSPLPNARRWVDGLINKALAALGRRAVPRTHGLPPGVTPLVQRSIAGRIRYCPLHSPLSHIPEQRERPPQYPAHRISIRSRLKELPQ